jgi:hypothetical protein
MKTHWKKLTNPNYLGSWDFEEKEERVLTIKSVSQETVKDQNGNDDEVVLMEFTTGKPMILNKTNLKATEKALGTAFIEEWANQKVTIYTTLIKAFGEQVNALRISPSKPQEKVKPELTPERFKKAIEAVKSGEFTSDQLLTKYNLKEEQVKQLKTL